MAKVAAYFGMSLAAMRQRQARFSPNAVSNASWIAHADTDEMHAARHPASGSAKFTRTQNAAAYATTRTAMSRSAAISAETSRTRVARLAAGLAKRTF